MAYIDYTFFNTQYPSVMTEAEFNSIVTPCCDVIDSITNYYVAENGLTALPTLYQTLFQKACAAEVAYVNLYGLEVLTTGNTGGGFTVGKVSVQEPANVKRNAGRAYGMVSPIAYTLLEQTGLLNRQVACLEPFQGPYLPTQWW
jgi:hypothetical protein